MPNVINVIKGGFDLKELPLAVQDDVPTELSEGSMVIVRHGTERWIYWNTEGTIYKAKGTLVV